MIPEFGFPFPFTHRQWDDEEGDLALTLVDLRMIELSYALRSKPSWWTKIKDPAIRSKWKAEALEHEIRGEVLNDAEIEWVLDELEDYALMRDEATGIQPSCHVRVWESDELVSQDLRSRLKIAASVLENVHEEEKDWHPRSNNQVLDLVHPSLFCAVYGRTQHWVTSNGGRKLKPVKILYDDMENWAYSDEFAWIPTDFQLEENGTPATALGYINNVHPKQHKDLIRVIESLVGRFSLLWDKVLTDIHPDNNDCLPGSYKVVGAYEWDEHPDYPQPSWQEQETIGREEFYRRLDAYEENKIITLPTVDESGYRESGEDITSRECEYSIQGKVVQVIVKLANIHLTPEKPEYPGGSWHVEGMANERIVASGIYYYDCENITESQLAFRTGVHFEGANHDQGDSRAIRLTWGLERDGQRNQVVGAVKTSANRCIAFPNIYQHQVSSFKLVDPTKPGHRKIVALFLVDPENRIPSTSDIPPQQSHWIHEAIVEALVDNNNTKKVSLPVELVDMVADQVDTTMTLEEAKAYRLELMDERTAFVDVVDEENFCTEFNFCEH
ncbi:hypothetical protein M407DRAFT_28449 [Tulasnella calospora MUT 4182]|uniref:Uncharacterized protein n=1 Tax=Tulasnella calospora MUT 4182 TaxID=1051891 RepID=A0A0C3LKT1_9AGAM|nr:hypothetical protein M407DRAFT_28449 [Tulasnella calospora MUT 4182]